MVLRKGFCQVVAVDEIGNETEAKAIRSIGNRGIAVVADAHGHNLGDVLENPDFDCLLGDKSTVILGDLAAQDR